MPLSSILTRPDDAVLDQLGEVETLSRAIHPHLVIGERIEARYIDRRGVVQREFYPDAVSLAGSVQRRRGRWNCYYGVVVRDADKGTAEHCVRAEALYADADLKLWATEPDPRAAARAAFRRFGLRPTAIVDTGNGFHVYLGLGEPVDVRDPACRATFEAVNAAFARALCGHGRKPDEVHDVARILRAPGSYNFKTTPPRAVRLDWCDPARRYSLADIAAYLDAHHHWAMDEPRPIHQAGNTRVEGGEPGGRPGDDYNRRGDMRPILRKHGWNYLHKRGDLEYWQRPNKRGRGTSATLNYGDFGLLYVFTSDGAPFDALTAYAPFSVYALLEHRGDYKEAAKALAAEGYGDQKRRRIHLSALDRPAGRRLPDLARPLGQRLAEVAR